MTMGDTEGTVESLSVYKNKQIFLSFLENIQHLVIYVYSGQIKIEGATIEAGDLAVLENPTKSIELFSIEKCDLIITKVFQ